MFDEGIEPAVYDRAGDVVVFVQHWGVVTEQVPSKQLWIQVSNLPHNVPHDRLLAIQLRGDCVDEAGADADRPIHRPVLEDRRPQLRLLRLRRQR